MCAAKSSFKLSRLLAEIGRVGKRMELIGACEASAGNISIFVGKGCLEEDVDFPIDESFALPYSMSHMGGGCFIFTGSGTRLPDIAEEPQASVGLIKISENGEEARMCTSPLRIFSRPTCEFNSHIAVHQDRIAATDGVYSAVVHAQPLYITFLSFIRKYQNEAELNRSLFSWQTECLIQIPNGIGYIPFHTPGSPKLESDNLEKLRKHLIVLWAKHGVMARADDSVLHACDYIEYLETSAKCEFMNMQIGGLADGLLREEIDTVYETFNIQNRIV